MKMSTNVFYLISKHLNFLEESDSWHVRFMDDASTSASKNRRNNTKNVHLQSRCMLNMRTAWLLHNYDFVLFLLRTLTQLP